MRKNTLILSVFGIVAVIFGLIFFINSSRNMSTLGSVIRKLGYTELQRQADFLRPGTIVAVKSALPFEATRVCSALGALGKDFKAGVSNTVSLSSMSEKLVDFKVSADYMSAINAKLGFNAVKQINLQLSNTKIYEITDEDVIEAARQGNTSEACKIAISKRFDQGRSMTMISAALEADVVYNVQFQNAIESAARFALIQDIAPELAIDAKVMDKENIRGNKLIFGIIDDRQILTSFASIVPGLPKLAVSESINKENRRLIPENLSLIVSEN